MVLSRRAFGLCSSLVTRHLPLPVSGAAATQRAGASGAAPGPNARRRPGGLGASAMAGAKSRGPTKQVRATLALISKTCGLPVRQ